MLNKLEGKASIKQLVSLGKQKNLYKDFSHVIKVRDALIRLKQRGIVKRIITITNEIDDLWVIVRQPSPEELRSKKRHTGKNQRLTYNYNMSFKGF